MEHRTDDWSAAGRRQSVETVRMIASNYSILVQSDISVEWGGLFDIKFIK